MRDALTPNLTLTLTLTLTHTLALTRTLTLTPTLTLTLTPTPTRCDALYCPSLNVMVFDHRPTEASQG